MKLKQLFENTQPPMTDQEALALVQQHFPGYHIQDVRVNSQGGIHAGLISDPAFAEKFSRTPLQLASAVNFTISGLETLNNLPLRVEYSLTVRHAEIQDLSTASPVGLSRNTILRFDGCPNLTSLKGLENFKVEGGKKIREIEFLDSWKLAIDLFDYAQLVRRFDFHYAIPRNVKLVRATTMSNMQISIYDPQDPQIQELENIINKYQGQGRGAALKMANELRAAKLEHHVDWAQ
jgi:hypothetical protein